MITEEGYKLIKSPRAIYTNHEWLYNERMQFVHHLCSVISLYAATTITVV